MINLQYFFAKCLFVKNIGVLISSFPNCLFLNVVYSKNDVLDVYYDVTIRTNQSCVQTGLRNT